MRGTACTVSMLATLALVAVGCGDDENGEATSESGDPEALALEFVQQAADGDLNAACDIATKDLRYGPCNPQNLAEDGERLAGAEVEQSLTSGDIASVQLSADNGNTVLIIDLLLVDGVWKVHDYNATYD